MAKKMAKIGSGTLSKGSGKEIIADKKFYGDTEFSPEIWEQAERLVEERKKAKQKRTMPEIAKGIEATDS